MWGDLLQSANLRASTFHTEDLWAAPHYAFAGVGGSSDFGTNAVAEVVSGKIEGVQEGREEAR